MEDDLKILKVEYLSNYWSDINWNICFGDQIEFGNYFKLNQSPVEDDVEIS